MRARRGRNEAPMRRCSRFLLAHESRLIMLAVAERDGGEAGGTMANVRNVAAAGFIVSLISAWPTLAEEYPFDVAKKCPASMRAWQSLVPSDFRREPWIFRLDGAAGPLDTVSVHGRVFLYGSVCKPA